MSRKTSGKGRSGPTGPRAAGRGAGQSGTRGGTKTGARGARTAARQRVAAMRAGDRRRQRRTKVITAAAILAGIVGLAVLIMSQVDKVDAGAARPAGVTEAGGGIVTGAPLGSGKPVVEIYEDFQCQHCKQLEGAIGPTLRELADSQAATVIYRPIAILGALSVRASAAVGCAQDAGEFQAFHDALFANQEAAAQAGGFSPALLVEYGTQAGLSGDSFARCVQDQTYDRWATDATISSSRRGVHSTPTVFVNDKQLALQPADPKAATVLLDAVGSAG